MFRRSSKLTAMLVAAAAVVSIVPASAAERLGTKEGNITNAAAFDGGYIYDGYRTDDDDAALYYNNGDKDVNVDEDEDYDTYSLDRYGDKYATVWDGTTDEYLVDLSTGKIDDDETVSDKRDDAKNKLKSKINKEDRYTYFKASKEFKEFDKILDGKYGEVWYKYAAEGDKDTGKRMTTSSAALYDDTNCYIGFTNESGKYIDVSQTANMYIYLPESQLGDNATKGKTVKFEEYGDENYDVTVKLDNVTAVAQDEDYIYAVAQVSVRDINNDSVSGVQSTQYFFQKISKAQGDKKDGAYLPKSVTSYQLDTNNIYDNGDMNTATKALLSAVDYENNVDEDDSVKDSDGRQVVNVEVKDGVIYATAKDNDKVKVWKLKFKKDKVDAIKEKDSDGKITEKVANVDAYVVKKDGDGDNDIVNGAISIDIDGNTWALDKGKILKADGTDFKEVYTVDRSINELDVYDENNLIAWDSEGDVYTTVTEGKKQTEEDAGVDTDKKDETDTTIDTTVKAGWNKNADGTWTFYKDGSKATGWVNDNGTWYYLDTTGTMKTGWVQAGSWYYLNASGAMQTGWINDNGTWYYCNASGAMQTGWLLDGSTWYYLQPSGAMAANTTINGYVLGANGAWIQ